ncbi:zinc-dependent alcohol dehydrogenase family protein [Pedobacter cryoconitis]|uniref:NADPH:quinone reductase-like Zn-dependent oxidoreductase n=1 Tax=Pedobacter cryoconitis TaxID=188932 RepID=A0A7X0MH59_9SPHI|nr:NAD(P)-dependent alcohol dehydrogenase [Pedobacter cryoconitis]MBB6498799.1 NADPH:quinone reductase-like Zn-dependent oxidoreductase [Pedobacter cryoconitis]
MKTYQITEGYSIASLALIEKDYPKLQPHEVLVKIHAASLNYRDLLVIKGVADWKPPVGRIPLSDGAGTVVETGREVTTVTKTDKVAGLFLPKWISGKLTADKKFYSLGGRIKDGLLQEYAVFHESELIRVPAFLSHEEAATLPCAALTAWHALIEKGGIRAGSTVLIQGTGGVSLFAIQFAQMAGAEVILLSGSEEKLALAKQLGVSHLINYKQIPDWEKDVMQITNGIGVDHVVEVVGGSHINKSMDVIALDGTISVIGLIGGLSGDINTSKIMTKQIKLQGIETGSKEMFDRMNKAIAINKLHPVINKLYSFEETKEALFSLEQGSHFGKICLTF